MSWSGASAASRWLKQACCATALGAQPFGCVAVEAQRPGLDHHAIFLTRELDRGDFSAGMAELATAAADGVIPKLAIERLDGDPLIGSGLEETLIGVGFSRQPRKFVASA